jgi:hypothetical protein
MNDNVKKSLQTIGVSSFIVFCILLLWQPIFVINLRQSDIQNKKVFDFYKLIAISILCGTVIGMILFINDVKTFNDDDENFVEEVVIHKEEPRKPPTNFAMKESDFY